MATSQARWNARRGLPGLRRGFAIAALTAAALPAVAAVPAAAAVPAVAAVPAAPCAVSEQPAWFIRAELVDGQHGRTGQVADSRCGATVLTVDTNSDLIWLDHATFVAGRSEPVRVTVRYTSANVGDQDGTGSPIPMVPDGVTSARSDNLIEVMRGQAGWLHVSMRLVSTADAPEFGFDVCVQRAGPG